ncbi:flagellar biosynthesis protein FliQ [Aliibacillus thermotolerans]|uniref:Flagellar biosynthetic protein FliQ n=1 Tax=Aliibacillus thermotolerans TaxID=1834418 RepID=A0ABW0U5Q6_9BACI|nr:flagellar biosynthesis protein FliQ [Aliibacillus thermotolerans]MDA3130600.1 flagellar biosynthesis protein FliQ [Aliibacillus thermotolerans]
MTAETVINIAENGVLTVFFVAGPLLIIALLLGFGVAIFQATTQIQEQTLAFIPKILGVLASLVLFGPWMLSQLVHFTYQILNNLHQFIG